MIWEQVTDLPLGKLLHLRQRLSEAALAMEMRGYKSAQEIFRRAKHTASPGVEKRLYTMLQNAQPEGIRRLCSTVEKHFGGIKL